MRSLQAVRRLDFFGNPRDQMIRLPEAHPDAPPLAAGRAQVLGIEGARMRRNEQAMAAVVREEKSLLLNDDAAAQFRHVGKHLASAPGSMPLSACWFRAGRCGRPRHQRRSADDTAAGFHLRRGAERPAFDDPRRRRLCANRPVYQSEMMRSSPIWPVSTGSGMPV